MILIDPPREDLHVPELARFARLAQKLTGVAGEVSVLITGNRRLRELNHRFRQKDKPTDVLSFPSPDDGGGDISISAEIAAANAACYGHPVSDELKILILHGLLHLAGYDHERDNGEMAARETVLRRRLKLPTTLIERSSKVALHGTRRAPKAKGSRPRIKGGEPGVGKKSRPAADL